MALAISVVFIHSLINIYQIIKKVAETKSRGNSKQKQMCLVVDKRMLVNRLDLPGGQQQQQFGDYSAIQTATGCP